MELELLVLSSVVTKTFLDRVECRRSGNHRRTMEFLFVYLLFVWEFTLDVPRPTIPSTEGKVGGV